MSTGKDKKPPCNCRNSCQTKDGPKRKGCPCRTLSVNCTADCRCGTDKYPCKNIETSCKCQNSCQTKTGPRRAGCPCRDEGLSCTERCNCGTKKYPCENIEKPDTQTLSDSHTSISADNPRPKITRTLSGPPKKEPTVVDNSDTIDDSMNVTSGFFTERRYTVNKAWVSIINICSFDQNVLPERIGSGKDVNTIKTFCKSKKFQYELVQDQTTTGIETHFNTIIKEFDTHDFPYDAFICFLMSHGKNDMIYGRAANLIAIDVLTSKVLGCKALKGKPKIFFIQACRSSEDIMHDGEREQPCLQLPRHSDMLLAHATFDGLNAYRTRVGGSWFISSLVRVLNDHCRDQHLMDCMTVVNELVATEKATGRHLQMPCQTSTLTKFVYFK